MIGMNLLFPVIATIVVGLTLAKTVSPSVMEKIVTTKVESKTVDTQNAIYEAIQRYTTLEGVVPTNMNDLVTKGYFLSSNNTNGFGGTYDFSTNAKTGVVSITTSITNAKAKAKFVNSSKNTLAPVEAGTTGNFTTTFILPTSVLHGNGKLSGGVLIQSTAPNASTNKYWYDTSGTEVVLKLSDGANWKNISGGTASGSGGTSVGTIVNSSSLSNSTNTNITSGTNGEIKYAYDSGSNTIQQYAYYNGSWLVMNESQNNITFNFFKYITINNGTTCGIDSTDKLYCWGANNYGQVGDNSTVNKLVPTLVSGGLTFKSIVISNNGTSCGIDSTDKLYCWGANNYGQVGDNSTVNKLVPTLVFGGLTWKSITTNNGTTCGIDSTDKAYCWGYNNGQSVPTKIN